MYPYFLLFFIVALLAFFGAYSNRRIFLILIFIILTLFSGFRYNVGVDYPNYVKIFNGEKGYSAKELGFNFLIDFLHAIGGTYQLMFLLLAIIMNVLVYKIIRYYSTDVWLSCLIYLCVAPFYFSSFNGTRQYIAIAIFLYSLRFIETKKYKKYISLNLIGAFFFHSSLLFIAPLFPLIKKELSLKMKFLIICGAIISNLFLEYLLSLTPYLNYLNIEKQVKVSTLTYILLVLILPIVVFDKKMKIFKKNIVLFNLVFFCFLTLLLVVIQQKDILIQMFMRINSYFFFIFIVFVPVLLKIFQKKEFYLFPYAIVLFGIVAYFLTAIIYNGENSALVPYQTNFYLFN